MYLDASVMRSVALSTAIAFCKMRVNFFYRKNTTGSLNELLVKQNILQLTSDFDTKVILRHDLGEEDNLYAFYFAIHAKYTNFVEQ